MKAKSMQKWISGMVIVASFVFIISVIGGVQKDTIDALAAVFYILGSFVLFLLGFFFLVAVDL